MILSAMVFCEKNGRSSGIIYSESSMTQNYSGFWLYCSIESIRGILWRKN